MDDLTDKNSTFGVPRRREEVIEILNQCYSSDLLDLEEFERRVERAHGAVTVGDLERVLADVPENLRTAVHPVPAPPLSAEETIAIRSSSRTISGAKLGCRLLTIDAQSSSVTLDYLTVTCVPSDQEIRVDLKSSALKIVASPGTRIVDDVSLQSSTIRTKQPRRFGQEDSGRTLRLTGIAVSSTIKVKFKKVKPA